MGHYDEMIEEQKKEVPSVVQADLTGKTIMITGANSGSGFEAAKHFAKMNPARLIFVCRSLEKARQSIEQIEADTGYKKAEPLALDLSNFRTISESVTQATKILDRLDILVENAAVSTAGQYVLTEDGFETMLQVNALGPALHTFLLLPLMQRTARKYSVLPRIVVVSSGLAFLGNISEDAVAAPNTLETLSSKGYCTPLMMDNRYNLSKIINIMFINKLANHLPKCIIPVALNPGFFISGLRRHETGERAEQFSQMEAELAWTPEEGSRQIVFAAIGGNDNGMELRGKFTSFSRVRGLSDWMLSEKGRNAEDKIWNDMLELFGKIDSRIPGICSEHLKEA
ncbi:hypothetical protein GYMLUDRAFT_42685 [Collybiopsis luxurians FD-317 M1]|uniref:Uncharacterized protein n=1 Tax=Collybiopsis luxurians FD-317 M1 TaxID=944289 RepID=A0A0D0BDA2_9AGAR|nr:hypothetical protein GYMLUDRAFT_42685 [Collybiopsis luxurians FD-317 M1]